MFGLDLGTIFEKVCDTIGLPEQVGDIAKVAVNIYIGDYVGAVEGVANLAGMDDAPKAASTEYHKPDRPTPPPGYAPSSPPPAASAAHASASTVHPRKLEALEHLDTLKEYFGMAESAGAFLGTHDGQLAKNDLNAIASGNYPPDLKEAAQFFLQNPDLFDRMGTPDFLAGTLVNLGGIDRLKAEIQKEVDAAGVTPNAKAPRPPPGRASTPPPATQASTPPPAASTAHASTGTVHPRKLEALEHLDTLKEYFAMAESAGAFLGIRDGQLAMNDLRAIASGNYPADLKEAAQFFIQNPDLFDRMGTPGFLTGTLVNMGGIDRLKAEIQNEVDAAGVTGNSKQTPQPPPTPGQSGRVMDGTTLKEKYVKDSEESSSAKSSGTSKSKGSSGSSKSSKSDKSSSSSKSAKNEKSSKTDKNSDKGGVGALVDKLGQAQMSATEKLKALSELPPDEVNPAELQQIQMELNRISEMMSMISNMMQSLHQMNMGIIGNMRG